MLIDVLYSPHSCYRRPASLRLKGAATPRRLPKRRRQASNRPREKQRPPAECARVAHPWLGPAGCG